MTFANSADETVIRPGVRYRHADVNPVLPHQTQEFDNTTFYKYVSWLVFFCLTPFMQCILFLMSVSILTVSAFFLHAQLPPLYFWWQRVLVEFFLESLIKGNLKLTDSIDNTLTFFAIVIAATAGLVGWVYSQCTYAWCLVVASACASSSLWVLASITPLYMLPNTKRSLRTPAFINSMAADAAFLAAMLAINYPEQYKPWHWLVVFLMGS